MLESLLAEMDPIAVLMPRVKGRVLDLVAPLGPSDPGQHSRLVADIFDRLGGGGPDRGSDPRRCSSPGRLRGPSFECSVVGRETGLNAPGTSAAVP